MPILKYTTKVPVNRSLNEVQTLLAKRGANRIATLFDDDGDPSGLAFTLETEFGPREFALPVRIDGVLDALATEPGVTPAQRTKPHAARVAWRIALEWLEVQFALVDANQVTLPEVMFPYMVSGSGRTAYQLYAESQRELTA